MLVHKSSIVKVAKVIYTLTNKSPAAERKVKIQIILWYLET